MGSIPAEVAWEQIGVLISQTFEYQFDQSNALLQQMNMEECLRTSLEIHLSRINPVVGVNEFLYINKNVDLSNILKEQPLEILKAVLRIFTVSDRWASRNP